MKKVISLFLTINSIFYSFAQQQYCNGNISSNAATINLNPDADDCNFSLKVTPYYSVNQDIAFPTPCSVSQLSYEYKLFLNTGLGFSLIDDECTNDNPYTFTGLSQPGTYKAFVIYFLADYCPYINQYVLDLYLDEGISVITMVRNICPLSPLGSSLHWYDEMDINCTVPNNTATIVTSGTAILLKPGFSMSASPNGYFSASIENCSSLHRPVHDFTMGSIDGYNDSISLLGADNTISVVLFPNPTKGPFTLQLTQSGSPADNPMDANNYITVYNVFGQTIYQTTTPEFKINLDLSAQPRGVYLVRVQSGNNYFTKKVVVQ